MVRNYYAAQTQAHLKSLIVLTVLNASVRLVYSYMASHRPCELLHGTEWQDTPLT